jgi:PAS domain S-box-containing protein
MTAEDLGRPPGTAPSAPEETAGPADAPEGPAPAPQELLETLAQLEGALAEQTMLSAFEAEFNQALTRRGSLREMLQACAEAVVRHLGAAFARIWSLNKPEGVLELQASAGPYTHLSGAHSRIPVGQLKIGRIARDGRPDLTNNLGEDPEISDPEWARHEGIVAFAGQPLVVDGEVMGVLALFARQPLSGTVPRALAQVANNLALGMERKRGEEALQASEALYQSLVENLPQNIYRKDRGGRFTYVNTRFCALLGRWPEEILGKTDADFFPPDLAAKYRRDDQYVLDSGQLFEAVEEHRPPGTGRLWVHVVKIPIRDARGAVIGTQGIFWDITARQRAEEELRRSEARSRRLEEVRARLLNRVLTAQEKERAHLSRELHDGLCQALSALLVGLQNVQAAAALEEAQDRAGELRRLAAATVAEARRLARGLRPAVLDDFGLGAALKQLASDHTRPEGPTVEVDAPILATLRLPAEVETTLYRIAQEAVGNSVRHAAARTIRVRVTWAQDRAEMVVQDDGSGFEPDDLPRRPDHAACLGLTGMHERARLLGGTVTVASRPGEGTTVTVSVPVGG